MHPLQTMGTWQPWVNFTGEYGIPLGIKAHPANNGYLATASDIEQVRRNKHTRHRMWDMSICKHMASVRADFDLPYSLPLLCQIGPELCELGINLNPCPCATNVCLQIVNNRSLFRDTVPLVTMVK